VFRLVRNTQIVNFWTVNRDMRVEAIEFPRLDTFTRCVGYTLGLALMNRQGFGQAIKACHLRDQSQIFHFGVHYFIDVPLSKRIYCCEKHAQTDRKRRERASARQPTRKHK
jgi:hypothetical protein